MWSWDPFCLDCNYIFWINKGLPYYIYLKENSTLIMQDQVTALKLMLMNNTQIITFYYVCSKEKNNCVPQCNFIPYYSKYFHLNKIIIKMFCTPKFFECCLKWSQIIWAPNVLSYFNTFIVTRILKRMYTCIMLIIPFLFLLCFSCCNIHW